MRLSFLSLRPVLAVTVLTLLWPGNFGIAQVQPEETPKGTRGPRRVFEDYDLRLAEWVEPAAKSAARAAYQGRYLSPERIADVAALTRGIEAVRTALSARIPTLQVESNLTGRFTEIVGVTGASQFLTAPSSAAPEAIVRGFLTEEAALYGLTPAEVKALLKFTDYTNPSGNLSWVEFRQEIHGLPVFQGEIRAALTPRGALVRTTGNLVPALDPSLLSVKPRLSAGEAVGKAAATIDVFASPAMLRVRSSERNGRVTVMGGGPFDGDTRAELVWFPVEPGVAVLAWSLTLWRPIYSYLVMVDANDGTLLWRKCITQHQTQTATYSVYTSDSPAPLSPTNVLPGAGTQAPGVARTTVTLIADDLTASPLGWITDGNNSTLGNNVTAGVDLSTPNGVDSNVTGTARVFDFAYNPPPLGTDAPNTAVYRNGIVTNLFFWTNRYHDRLWQLGFTEPARNFQTTNTFNAVNRGGLGNDAISAEAQDFSGTNNANFSTPGDGSPGRMQMYLLTAPSPQRDGSLDGDVFLHELTHGTSNRLHNNGSGLATRVSGGMGEGWSDFYARGILATADEDVNAIFASGTYVTLNLSGVGTNNYYYGIRRFPYAVKANVGANGRPHNPLRLGSIDTSKMNLSTGAFPPAFVGASSEVHNIGEVWCMMLLEFRARLINRLGFAVGNTRALQIVTDGMKLDPTSPTMLSARDALIAAANAGAGGAADANDVRIAFALRGAGAGSTSTNPASGEVSVTESFSPDVSLNLANIAFSDSLGNNNGIAEPGEDLILSIPLTNPGAAAISVTAAIGANSANYGSIGAGATVTQTIRYAVPVGASIGSVLSIPIDVTGPVGTGTFTYLLRLGSPSTASLQNFDGVTPPALPAGWTSTTAAAPGGVAGTAWVTTTANPVDAPNSAFSPDLAGNNTAGGEASLVSPGIAIPSPGASLTFRHRWTFESGFDGGILEVAIPGVNGGAFQDILAAGGSFVQGAYTVSLNASSTLNPLGRRPSFSGTSAAITTVAALPPSANGQTVQFRWRLGFDESASSTGWNVDSVGLITYSGAPVLTAAVDDTSGTPIISFPSVLGRIYVVEYKDDLTTVPWSPIQTGIAGTDSVISVPDNTPGVGTAPQRFYRVRITGP